MLIDDAQWLDGPSAQALLFAFRRLLADPVAVLVAVREGEPSLLDGADLPALRIGGLTARRRQRLLPGLPPGSAAPAARADRRQPAGAARARGRRRGAALRPRGRTGARVGAHLRRVPAPRRRRSTERRSDALVLAATSDSGDLAHARAGGRRTLELDLAALTAAEAAGLVTLRAGAARVPPPARAFGDLRRRPRPSSAAPRTARSPRALPDRDVDRRAWHLAAAAVGPDAAAAAALEQAAGARASAAPTRPPPQRSSAPRS